jgi:hypothetical protein
VTEKLDKLIKLEELEELRRRRWTIDHRTMDKEWWPGLLSYSPSSIVP